MNLNQITANIRLRSVWEAVDLGFVMVQEWWKAIYIPLAILLLGIAFPLFYFLPEKAYWIGGMLIWWLKPLYDRLILHIISHKLFNEELSSKQALKALPSLIWNTGMFQTLTFRRFSLSRGFNLPIWQLEQLRGSERAKRQQILHLAAHSQAVWLTISLWLVEVIMLLSLFALLLMFLPQETAEDFLEGIFTDNIEYKRWIDMLNSLFYVAVVLLVHPFYIAGNFALYINRRTQLEAWDIELDFKKMGQRFDNINKTKQLSSSTLSLPALLLIAASLFYSLTPAPAIAKEAAEILAPERKPVEQSRKMIDEVMLTDNLNDKKKVMKWVKIEQQKKKKKKSKTDFDWLEDLLQPIGLFIAVAFEYILWIGIAIGLFLLYYFRDRWLYLFQGSKKKPEDEYVAPEVMFGMDVRPDSLPNDIIGSSRDLWQQGKHRESLSLLYRGALIRLINEERVQLESSHTEGDVLKHSAKKLSSDKSQGETKLTYLKLLTRQWQSIAYAHRTPDETSMQTLFDSWLSDFTTQVIDEPAENGGNDE